jgi:hypothetical protein
MPKSNARQFGKNLRHFHSRWDEAVYDAEQRIRQLRQSIRIFRSNAKSGLPFPTSESEQSENQKGAA